jgi:hypothetical protein
VKKHTDELKISYIHYRISPILLFKETKIKRKAFRLFESMNFGGNQFFIVKMLFVLHWDNLFSIHPINTYSYLHKLVFNLSFSNYLWYSVLENYLVITLIILIIYVKCFLKIFKTKSSCCRHTKGHWREKVSK